MKILAEIPHQRTAKVTVFEDQKELDDYISMQAEKYENDSEEYENEWDQATHDLHTALIWDNIAEGLEWTETHRHQWVEVRCQLGAF